MRYLTRLVALAGLCAAAAAQAAAMAAAPQGADRNSFTLSLPLTALPATAERLDSRGALTLYRNSEAPDRYSIWLADSDKGTALKVCVTNPDAPRPWNRMQNMESDAVEVPITDVTAADRGWIVGNGPHRKIVVEGCPDFRNVSTYIIDVDARSARMLPSQEEVQDIDNGDGNDGSITVSSYGYDDEGRYSYLRVYTLDGKFIRQVGDKLRD